MKKENLLKLIDKRWKRMFLFSLVWVVYGWIFINIKNWDIGGPFLLYAWSYGYPFSLLLIYFLDRYFVKFSFERKNFQTYFFTIFVTVICFPVFILPAYLLIFIKGALKSWVAYI